MILFYNTTKGGVDTFDQMCSPMSCNRETNKWPMAVFYSKNYMQKLSYELSLPWMEKRLTGPTLNSCLRQNIIELLPKSTEASSENIMNEPT